MKHLVRLLIHPALLMMIAGAVYVMARVPSSDRLPFFAVIALTAVGVTELVTLAIAVAQRSDSPTRRYAHLVTGAGALTMAVAALNDVQVVAWVVGGLLFAAGGLIGIRATQRSV